MLTQLIYRSRSTRSFSSADLAELVRAMTSRNRQLRVNGLLLFDGDYFLQVLEGTPAAVDGLYRTVCQDPRHTQIVLLLRDPIPTSRFADFRMNMLDVRDKAGAISGMGGPNWSGSMEAGWHRSHRSERIIEAFVCGRWRDARPALAWSPNAEVLQAGDPRRVDALVLPEPEFARFALQPIVHPRSKCITSFEALLRGPAGESPQSVLGAVGAAQLHAFDLHSKADAIALASALDLDCVLSVNLLPMSLVANSGAVEFLLQQCARHRWPADRLLVEITEEEAITHFDAFLGAVQMLRASGIQVAIDDFGAGHAGLSLLADFQPDKLKIDKRIIQGVSASGARQAIVRSVVEFCYCLGITVVAEGVESAEDWSWLQSAGVDRFQGFLFARPRLQGVAPITWPSSDPFASQVAPMATGALAA